MASERIPSSSYGLASDILLGHLVLRQVRCRRPQSDGRVVASPHQPPIRAALGAVICGFNRSALPEVHGDGFIHEVGLACSAVVESTDDPTRTLAEVVGVGPGVVSVGELVAQRRDLADDVVVLFS